jgi:hypothetical protein
MDKGRSASRYRWPPLSGYLAPAMVGQMLPWRRMIPMRSVLTAAAAALMLGGLAGCVPQGQTAASAHPNSIIVRAFAFSPEVVTLDPSFGFSLSRRAPGVPPGERAAAVGRAAAFSLADAITTQLGLLGYDAIRSDTAVPGPGARALIVSGAFRHIDAGRRRHVGAENPNIAVDVDVDYQAGAAAPQRITELHLDSRQIPPAAIVGASVQRGVDVTLAASRVGGAIARYMSDTARLNNWPEASR